MTDDGIQWILGAKEFSDMGYCLTFSQGITVNELVGRLGGSADEAVPMTLDDAEDAQFDEDATEEALVRVGSTKDWVYSVAPGFAIPDLETAEAISTDARTVMLSNNSNAVRRFTYLANGREICGFEPGAAHFRTGADSNMFLPAMIRVGLLFPDGRSPAQQNLSADVDRMMFRMVEEEFMISLPRTQVLYGELPTVRIPL